MADNKEALRRWGKLNRSTQNMLLENVFCLNCKVTTIIDYKIIMDKPDIVLKGKCKKCGRDVARLVESEWFDFET
jgi:hypothetical protein